MVVIEIDSIESRLDAAPFFLLDIWSGRAGALAALVVVVTIY